jgi:hypothetical protein
MTSAVTLSQSASAGNALNFKNRLINGDFEIWQRGIGPTYLTSGVYQADRWTCMGFQAARHQRVSVASPVEGMTARFANRVGSSTVAENSGGTRMTCDQKIESTNCYDLPGKAVTYSFWIRFSSATAASVANSTNSAFGNFNSYIAGSTTNTDSATSPDSIGTVVGVNVITNGSLPTTWTKITTTTTVPVGSNNVALRLGFGALGSTTNAGDVWYEVTECQVELGTIATSFDRRPYALELTLCQRYFYRVYGIFWSLGVINQPSGSWTLASMTHPTTMRTNPTFGHNLTDANRVTASPTANQWSVYNQNVGWGSISFSPASTFQGIFNGAGSTVQGHAGGYYTTFSSGATHIGLGSNLYIEWAAEL